ncbi:unnamed protein product [Clonostachys rhizophaga]|uniref:Protein kinase domain-containing protein n=1 Tax=Clonostachys rhizophaga TaxID=160324 RepID=A0A9N9V2B3_9HYPO|nr:unnamed protein product [Clonostachys rhizophaga]
METPTVPLDILPELVRDSELKVQFVQEGGSSFVIHTHTARRRSAEEKWLVKRHLRSGGQGSVDLQTRVVEEFGEPSIRAVKRIEIPDLHKAARSKMYQRELETIAKFSQAKFSKLFVTSYGWYLSPGYINIAMEYCELGDLNKYLRNSLLCPENRLPELDTREIVYQVLEALSTMHEENFCHRDLKLANILIKRTGPRWWVKVADFGLSKRGGNDSTTNFSAGSRGYMSPEISGFKDLDSKVDPYAVDMWGLGQVVSRLLTGQVLFPTQLDLGRYYFGDIKFPEKLLRDVGATDDVTDFVKSLTRIEPAKRLTALGALDHPWMDMSLNPGAESRSENLTEGSETMIDTEDPSNVWPDGFGAQPKREQTTPQKTQPHSNTRPDEPSANLGNEQTASGKAAEAHKDSGNQFFKEEKYDLAIEQYTKAIEIIPSSTVYLGNRAAAYMAHFRWEEALADCVRAMDLEIPTPKLRLRLGRIYTRLGKPKEALAQYEKIPDHVREKDVNRANHMAHSIKSAREALEVHKDYSSVLSFIDNAKVELGPLAPTPREWKLLRAEASIYLWQRDGDLACLLEAEEILRDLLGKDYNDSEAHHLDARIRVTKAMKPTDANGSSTQPTTTNEGPDQTMNTEAEDTRESVPGDATQPTSDVNSDSHSVSSISEYYAKEIVRIKTIGNEAYKKGQFAKALEVYSDALVIWPRDTTNNARVALNRAQAYIKLGEVELAIKDCERALRLDPSYEKPHIIKELAEKLLGETTKQGADEGKADQEKAPGDSPGATKKEASQAQDDAAPIICPKCGESFEKRWKYINHARQLDHFIDSDS